MLSISSSFYEFLTYFWEIWYFQQKMSSLDTYFCFAVILTGIEAFLYYIFTIYLFSHPWSVHDLRKRGRSFFFPWLTASLLPQTNAPSCHPESSFNKMSGQRSFASWRDKSSIATLTLEEQSNCLHRTER